MRVARRHEIEARSKALAAAKDAIADDIPGSAAAAKHGASEYSTNQAIIILTHGAKEEIDLLAGLEFSWVQLYEAVRSRLTPEQINERRVKEAARPKAHRGTEQRRRLMAAAAAVKARGISHGEAASEFGLNARSVSDAYTCLTHGTPEELAQIAAGELALSVLHERILKRAPDRARKPTVFTSQTKSQRKDEVFIFEKLRDALDALSALPSPQDVAGIVKKHSRRAETVDARLLIAHQWIEEFADAWTK